MKILTVVGARPQFIKAGIVSKTLAARGFVETLVHTGQHYDERMSGRFFSELDIPAPHHHLGIGSSSHSAQTGRMMEQLEALILSSGHPDAMLVYGDTNSTLAGALVASKLNLPIAHVEAGLRSFNRAMPEEVNRVVTDHLSTWCFCPTATAVTNLEHEGIRSGVHLCGDVMYEATLHLAQHFASGSALMDALRRDIAPHPVTWPDGPFLLATIHRAENTDHPERFKAILDGLSMSPNPVVLPAHPRIRPMLDRLSLPPTVHIIPPVGYAVMLGLVRLASGVVTDSGGLQKEAYWLETPCITVRDETEWVETLHDGWNQLAGADPAVIGSAFGRLPTAPTKPFGFMPPRHPSERIADALMDARRS